MKTEFSKAIEKVGKKDKNTFFLTGDLGFNAFENLVSVYKERFINAGIAEQNMVSVAAGMASMGLKPWVYSISPFITLKSTEQIRNDICHLNLPVKLVGIGGGYGYGIMGATHHILEDIAIYSSFPNIKIFVPAFLEDIEYIVKKIQNFKGPSYLRLNFAPTTNIKLPKYNSFRRILFGSKITVVVLGPLIHNAVLAVNTLTKKNIVDLWSVGELPFKMPGEFVDSIRASKNLIIVEEHTNRGGFGERIMIALKNQNVFVKELIHLYAKGYLSKLYGSHNFHQKENELDAKGILKYIKKML